MGAYEPYLSNLRALPFVSAAKVESGAPPRVVIEATGDTFLFQVAVERSHLSRSFLDTMTQRAAEHPELPWFVFAPAVGKPMGERLRSHNINYMDRAGNCYVALGSQHVAEIAGRRPPPGATNEKPWGHSAYRTLFGLLARPPLLTASVRDIAPAVGASKSAVSDTLQRLRAGGFLTGTQQTRRLRRTDELLDRWVHGYVQVLRPKLIVGRYRTRDTVPDVLEPLLEATLENSWAYGGAAGAWRLDGYYRSDTTVIHAPGFTRDVATRLRALQANDGPLWVLSVPGPVAFDSGTEHVVHPILLYAELLATDNDRAHDAATHLRDRFIST